MWLLLCALGLAAPAVTETQTYDRLFAEAPTAESISAPAEPGPALPAWAIPAGLLGLAGGLLLYKRMQSPGAVANVPALRVVQRQGIGERNALVLVEVAEPGGEIRRLLIGTGAGVPALLADLGMTEEVPANRAMPEAPSLLEAQKPRDAYKLEETDKKPRLPEADKKRSVFAEEDTKRPRSVFAEEDAKKPRLSANIADEILAERAPAPGRSREFSKILARIGEE